MTNNDIFAKMLHLTELGKKREVLFEIFRLGGNFGVSRSMIDCWRRPVEHKRASIMNDSTLKQFFDGLFAYRDMRKSEFNEDVFVFTAQDSFDERKKSLQNKLYKTSENT